MLDDAKYRQIFCCPRFRPIPQTSLTLSSSWEELGNIDVVLKLTRLQTLLYDVKSLHCINKACDNKRQMSRWKHNVFDEYLQMTELINMDANTYIVMN